MNTIWDVIPGVIALGGMFWFLKLLLEYLTKKRLIEKGELGEDIRLLITKPPEGASKPSLKWGMVAVGVGAALFISPFLPVMGRADDAAINETSLGLIFLCGGLALVIYYLIAGKMENNSPKK